MIDSISLVADAKKTQGGVKNRELVEDDLVTPYMPSDMVGGSIPYVAGTEDEAVWNAAAQACGTDRVHYTYTVADKRVWYLATPSASLASNPESWCPLAAALPGNSEYWDKETVYIYDQEGTAAGLRWEPETGRMQVFIGPSRTILPRLQTLDANFVSINAERAKPVFWRNRALNEERLSRFTVKWLFISGLLVAIVALGLWLMTHMIALAVRPSLKNAERETANATEQLMLEASKVIRNDSDRHVFRLQELLEAMKGINGTLVRYEVDSNGVVIWEALVPPAIGSTNLDQLKARVIGTDPDGRIRVQGRQ